MKNFIAQCKRPVKKALYMAVVFLTFLVTLATNTKTRRGRMIIPSSSPDGLSWATAYTNLHVAVSSYALGDTIWITAGTYQPESVTPFNFGKEVKIYGGYIGGKGTLSRNDWKKCANTT